MLKYAKDYVNLCDKGQRHGDMNLAPPAELTSLVSHWPFQLTYGTEAVVPIELTELIWRTNADTDFLDNSTNLGEEVDEVRNEAALWETSLKQKIAASHGKKVVNREFEVGDLVLRRNQKDYEEGKLAANWEGPYKVWMKIGTGAYALEDLNKGTILRTWNTEKLKRYYN